MRCYIDEPCEALQIQGMMSSFFQHKKQLQGMVTFKYHSVICFELSGKVVYSNIV